MDERERTIFEALRLGEKEMEVLRSLADYIWWDPPEMTLQRPDMLIAQVMQLGTFEDSMRLLEALGKERLRWVLEHAQAGQFTQKPWHYWHYMVADTSVGEVPPLPVRRFS